MEKNIEMHPSGLVCDNPQCDWRDPAINDDAIKDWINRPCPKCGENVLTEQDYDNAQILRISANVINAMSVDELKEFAAAIMGANLTDEDIKAMPMFAGAIGIQDIDFNAANEKIRLTISTHEEIRVTEIKKQINP